MPTRPGYLKILLAEDFIELRKAQGAEYEGPTRSWRSRATWEKDYLDRIGGHHDCIILKKVRADNISRKEHSTERGRCIICTTDVNTRCKQCKVALCIVEDPQQPSEICFYKFHSLKKFPEIGVKKLVVKF